MKKTKKTCLDLKQKIKIEAESVFHNIRPLQLTHIQIYPTNWMPRDACVCLFCFFQQPLGVGFVWFHQSFHSESLCSLTRLTSSRNFRCTSVLLFSDGFRDFNCIWTSTQSIRRGGSLRNNTVCFTHILALYVTPSLYMCIFYADFNQWSGWRICNLLLHIFHHLNHLVTTLTHRHSFSRKSSTSACTT